MYSVGIIDIGWGNIFSVAQAFNHIGANVRLIQQAHETCDVDILVLPGVGSFGTMMQILNEQDYTAQLHTHIKKGKPFMGICLGMQLLFDESEESGVNNEAGLCIFQGKVRRIPTPKTGVSYKIPNMGWRKVDHFESQQELLQYRDLCYQKNFYFMHSFMVDIPSNINEIYFSDIGGCFIPAMMIKENIMCTQFHPEKSGLAGLALIRHFMESQ